jgi:cytochrome c oxidase assembly factor CtaG
MGVGELVHMAGMGLLTSAVAPLLILAGRRRTSWRALSWPAAVALPFFVGLHAAITLGMEAVERTLWLHLLVDAILVSGAVVFWLPVLGTERRLDPLARCVYLFLAAPSLDLAGVVVVARGDSAGGLAMIVAMLPIGVVAVALTWQQLRAEESTARALDRSDPAAIAPAPDWVAARYQDDRVELPHAQP